MIAVAIYGCSKEPWTKDIVLGAADSIRGECGIPDTELLEAMKSLVPVTLTVYAGICQ
ncbi:MAG: hypothetical protein NC115_03390 [Bacteroidales bacterium]|nr:hypothetical protein [Bacteroidales bacterium]